MMSHKLLRWQEHAFTQLQREGLRSIKYEELALVYGMYRWKGKTARNKYLLRYVWPKLQRLLHRSNYFPGMEGWQVFIRMFNGW